MMFYKGFDKNLKCNGLKYEIGKEYKEEKASLCICGFHACENPLDVFSYYPPANSRYCEVELDELSEERFSDSKRCGRKIKIGAEIGIKGIIKAFIKLTVDNADWYKSKKSSTNIISTDDDAYSVIANTGDQSVATNEGYRSVSTDTGDQSVAVNTGDRSVATNTGYWSVATNTGDWGAAINTGNNSAAYNTGEVGAAINTGDQSVATNEGYHGVAVNTGDKSVAANESYRGVAVNIGDCSVATSTNHQSIAINKGDKSAAIVEEIESIAVATGVDGRAKGSLGCYIVLAEWEQTESSSWHIKMVKSHKVDGETIKPDTFYMLKDGEFVEVKD